MKILDLEEFVIMARKISMPMLTYLSSIVLDYLAILLESVDKSMYA